MEDLLYLRLKVRKNSTRRVTSKKMQDQMRDWNWLDTQIYNYYLKQLENKVSPPIIIFLLVVLYGLLHAFF